MHVESSYLRYKVQNQPRFAVNLTMASCEHVHCSAYSQDLCWRIVWQTETLGLSDEQAAKNLGVNKPTVYRINHTFLPSGSLDKQQRQGLSLTSPARSLVLYMAQKKTGMLLS